MCPKSWLFSFSIAVPLKIRSRSPKSNQFFVMSQLYIHENLARIHTLVHKILCRQESVMTLLTPMPTESAPKSICLPPHRMGLGDIMTHQSKWVRVPVGWRSCWPLYSRGSYMTEWFVNCFTKRKVTYKPTGAVWPELSQGLFRSKVVHSYLSFVTSYLLFV